MMKRAAISALLLAFALRPAVAEPAPDGGDKDRIEQARASLQERLSDAQSKGVVLLKGDARPSAHRAEAARVLRPGDANPVTCLTPTMLAETAALVEKQPSRTIDSLQDLLVDGRDGDRGELELQLATAFLVIGFAEEAAAVAAGRKDARAAAIVSLARLMSSAPPAADGAAAYVGCGDFYQMIAQVEVMLAGGAVEITDNEIGFLKSLPPTIAAPIAEALTLAALDRGDPHAAARLKSLLDGLAASSRRADATAYIDAALGGPTLSAEDAQQALAPIAATPGPLRERAIIALAPMMANAADDGVRLAFDHDLEDAAAGASSRGGALGLLLADRREQRGDISGSFRQLAAAHEFGEGGDGAAASAQRLLAAALHSGDKDRKLHAVAAVADRPAFAAPALSPADFDLVVAELVEFGAAEALDAALAARSVAPMERRAILARALLRAGRAKEAIEIAGPGAGDPDFAEILFIAGAFERDPTSEKTVRRGLRAAPPELLARDAMRRGDWQAAQNAFARLDRRSLAAVDADRFDTAAMAAGKSAPATGRSAAAVSADVAHEIDFIRQRISHE